MHCDRTETSRPPCVCSQSLDLLWFHQVPQPEVRVLGAVLQVVVRAALRGHQAAVRRPRQPPPAAHHRRVRNARRLLLFRRELQIPLNAAVLR